MSGACVSFIDVGKGDCILLQAGGSAVLIDTGYDETSAGVLFHLAQRGVSRLDCLVITHYDRDHVGGLPAIGRALGIGACWLPGYVGSDRNYRAARSAVEGLGLPALPVTGERHLDLGGYDLGVFPSGVEYDPGPKGGEGNDNDLSLVATLTGNGESYLFAGDLEKDGIDAFLRAGRGGFDVLKVPHHGIRSPRTDELVESVGPKIAVITDSASEPADKKTLKLLRECGAATYRTGASGTVVVYGGGAAGYSVSTAR